MCSLFPPQVVPGSGRGWQMFRVEGRQSGSPGGDLRATSPLDYENPEHRKGFRFRVQVTDMVGGADWVKNMTLGAVFYFYLFIYLLD